MYAVKNETVTPGILESRGVDVHRYGCGMCNPIAVAERAGGTRARGDGDPGCDADQCVAVCVYTDDGTDIDSGADSDACSDGNDRTSDHGTSHGDKAVNPNACSDPDHRADAHTVGGFAWT